MAEQSSGASLADIFTMDPSATVDTDTIPGLADALTEASERPTTPAAEDQPQEASFIPTEDELSADVQARINEINAKMQRNYANRLKGLQDREKSVEQAREAQTLVQRFYSDPQYAAQVLQQRAQQLGMTLTPATGAAPAGSAPSAPPTTTGTQTPQGMLDKVKEVFADSPELAFLAPRIAQIAWMVSQDNVQQAVSPLQKQAEDSRQRAEQQLAEQREAEFEQLAMELEEDGHDWRAHDDDMAELLQFITNALTNNGSLKHPRYGNLVRLLYNAVTGEQRTQAAAQAEAGRRLQRAVVNRTSPSSPARSPGPNVPDLLKKARTPQEKIAIAFHAALNEHSTARR